MIIQLLGAAGCGKSTLGQILSQELGIPLLCSDHYLWQDAEFTRTRPLPQRRALLQGDLARCPAFVLDGGLHGWLEEPLFTPDLLVLLRTDPALRMERLGLREAQRFGPRALPGGDHYETTQEFLQWAATYETAQEESNCLATHLALVAAAPCPSLVLWSHGAPPSLAQMILSLAASLPAG